MPHEGPVVPAVARLQHVVDRRLHGVRRQDAQNSREFQRVQTHRFHHVHHLRHLARLCSHLLRHAQHVPGWLHYTGLSMDSARDEQSNYYLPDSLETWWLLV